ncbi:MAG: tetratricopeptide repeat protein [Tsuneonella sp.]
MSFLPVILVAALAFAAAVLVLRLPRSGWALFGAALLFGLAGYALQGSPGEPGAPKQGVEGGEAGAGDALIEARRSLFDPDQPPSHFVIVADGFARRGQYGDAAGILRGALERDPADTEAWIALGNDLVEHADGQLTPAALYAYGQAEKLAPQSPAAPFFLGVALIRSGRLQEARSLWSDLLAKAPADAAWRPQLKERLDRLDVLIAQFSGQ